jgi:PTS system glucitol/sorbitol-specific IIA component
MKYEISITAIGNLARTFLENNSSVILLNEGLRPNLADMVVAHTEASLKKDIAVGDTFTWGPASFDVIAVGSKANQNLRDEGHCTLVFNAEGTMPGQIIVKGDVLPRLSIGDKLKFK